MSTTYRISITGIKTGIAKETAIKQLAELLKVSEEKAASMLDSQKFVVKSGVDLKTSAKYEAALQESGCYVAVESEDMADSLSFDIPILPGTEQTISTPQPSIEHAEKANDSSNILGTILSFFVTPPKTLEDLRAMSTRNKLIYVPTMTALLVILFSAVIFVEGLVTGEGNENLFDRATHIGVSTQANLDAFKNAGGIKNDDNESWRGYRVWPLNSYGTLFDDDSGELYYLIVTLSIEGFGHKFASFDSLRKSMAKECGNDWKQYASGISMSEKDGISCSIGGGRDGTIQISMNSKH